MNLIKAVRTASKSFSCVEHVSMWATARMATQRMKDIYGADL